MFFRRQENGKDRKRGETFRKLGERADMLGYQMNYFINNTKHLRPTMFSTKGRHRRKNEESITGLIISKQNTCRQKKALDGHRMGMIQMRALT